VRRTWSRPRAPLRRHLRLPVREVTQRRLRHAEVLRMWERGCRKRVCAAVAGTAAAVVVGKLVLRRVGLCLRLSFRAGLCLRLRLSLSLSLGLGLKGLDFLLPAEFLYELAIGACTAVRTQRGHRRLRVQRGSLRLYLDAKLTLCLGRPGLLKVVKMVGLRDLHLCHCRAP
jgi:hypothetical protein